MASPQAERTRESILSAAIQAFAEGGFDATSTRSIAKRAGVSQPLVLHYFGSKQGLIDAAAERVIQDYERAQQEQWALAPADPTFLTRGLDVLFSWLGQHPQYMRMVAWLRLEGRSVNATRGEAMFGEVLARFQRAQDEGYIRPEVDVLAALWMIDATLKGYWDRRASYAKNPHLDAQEMDRRFWTTTRSLWLDSLLTEKGKATLLD